MQYSLDLRGCFTHLNQLFEGKLLLFIDLLGHQQIFTSGNQELIVDVVYRDESGNIVISLTQYRKRDETPCPEMEMRIAINSTAGEAWALSGQTYTESGESIEIVAKILNDLLSFWLREIIRKNFKPIEGERD